MQEDIENKAIALSVTMTKFTAIGLAKILASTSREIRKANHQMKTRCPKGRQSIRSLTRHCNNPKTIPIIGETHLFDKIAHKWNIDYAFHKTGVNKYLLLFKSEQADSITSCFSDYTKLCMKRANSKHPRIQEQLRKSREQVRTKSKERELLREATHNDR